MGSRLLSRLFTAITELTVANDVGPLSRVGGRALVRGRRRLEEEVAIMCVLGVGVLRRRRVYFCGWSINQNYMKHFARLGMCIRGHATFQYFSGVCFQPLTEVAYRSISGRDECIPRSRKFGTIYHLSPNVVVSFTPSLPLGGVAATDAGLEIQERLLHDRLANTIRL